MADADSAASTQAAADTASTADYELDDSDFTLTDDELKKYDDGEDTQDVEKDPSPSKKKKASDQDGEEADEEPAEEEGEDKQDDADEDEPDRAEDTDDQPEAKNAAQNRIRELAAANKTKDAEIAQLRSQIDNPSPELGEPKTLEQLIEDVQNDPDFADASASEVRREARAQLGDQAAAIREYDASVAKIRETLEDHSQRIMADMPMFNPHNKERTKAQAAIAESVTQLYEQVAGMSYDSKTKEVNGVRVTPYDFYKSHNDVYEAGLKAGRAQRMAATAKNNAASGNDGRAAPTNAGAEDPVMDALDRALEKVG